MPKRKRVFIIFLAAIAFITGFGVIYAATPNFHSLDLERDLKQFLAVPDAPTALHDITDDMTVEAWVNFESYPCGNYADIASKFTERNRISWAFELMNTASCDTTHLAFIVSDDGSMNVTYGFSNDVAIEVGTWRHIAVAYDASTGSAQFYFDGIPAGEITGLDTKIYAGTSDFRIGARANPNDTEMYFDGKIDEVRIWNIVRTAQELKSNFEKELSGNENGLVGYWNFNGGAKDKTAEENNFSYTSDTTFTTDVPFFFALDSTQGEMIEGLAIPEEARPSR